METLYESKAFCKQHTPPEPQRRAGLLFSSGFSDARKAFLYKKPRL
jgi:hypothetical protein